MKFLLLIVAVILIGIFIVLSAAPFLGIGDFRLNDPHQCLNENLQNRISANKNEFLFLTTSKIQDKIKNLDPCILEVKVERHFPSKINLVITGFSPSAKIANTNFLITPNGYVFESQSAPPLPNLFIPSQISPTPFTKIEYQPIIFAAEIAYYLTKIDFLPTNIRFTLDNEIAVYNQKETVAIFKVEKDPISQINSLQQVISEAKIDSTEIAKIDLRFDQPIVTYK